MYVYVCLLSVLSAITVQVPTAGDDNTFIGFAKNAIDIVQCRMKPSYLEVRPECCPLPFTRAASW